MLSRFSSGNRSERTGPQVTRRRREASRTRLGVLGRAGRRRRIIAAGATAVVLAGAGVTYAATGFDQNQVGTEYANGIQVSDNQIIKPLGDRLLTQFGKFMGSTVSPDGRFLAATSADKSRGPADLRPLELQAHLDGRHGSPGRQPEPDRRHGRSGRPDVLAGRQVPLACRQQDAADPVPGQRRRHARARRPASRSRRWAPPR